MKKMWLAMVFSALAFPTLASAQSRAIDPAASKITIHAYKTGLFSFAGHDHVIEAPIRSGNVDEAGKTVALEVEAKSLRVLDPDESEKNRAEIQHTMLSGKVLDPEKYPEISFRSVKYEQKTGDEAEVRGELSLHGQVHEVVLAVKKSGERWTGSTRFKQTAFGIQPVAVAGGTVKVKDEAKVEFEVGLK
ncbi:MAG: YceI family protein [Acidobacteriaceae bacterium]